MNTKRRYFTEGTEINGQIIEDTGWYLFTFGQWVYDADQSGHNITISTVQGYSGLPTRYIAWLKGFGAIGEDSIVAPSKAKIFETADKAIDHAKRLWPHAEVES